LFQSIKNKYLPLFYFFTAEFPKDSQSSQSFFAFFAVKSIVSQKVYIFFVSLHSKYKDI